MTNPLMNNLLEVGALEAGNLLDALPDGAYITDRNRRIVYWNKAAERITGWGRGDVVGKGCGDNILVHVDKDQHALCGHEYCPLHRSMVTDSASTAPLLVFAQSKGGSRIPVEVTVAPVRDAAGEVIGGIEIFRDMSETLDDLNRARIIQGLSLGDPPPADDRLRIDTRYVPRDLVGGDFLRVERLDDDRYAVLVADVMGHGMAAALYTMQMRSLWEEYRSLLESPPDFLAMLNRCLHVLAKGDDHFATAIHLVANAATGEVTFSMAGHDRPLVLNAEGQPLAVPGARGPCLGILPQAKFSANQARIEPGQRLLLFTDGAVEGAGADGEELGREGLARILAECASDSGGDLLARLEEALVRFNRHIRLEDDLTLVLVERV